MYVKWIFSKFHIYPKYLDSLIHLCLASHKRGIGKQYRPRSDAAERGVWSGSKLFAINTGISTKHSNNVLTFC